MNQPITTFFSSLTVLFLLFLLVPTADLRAEHTEKENLVCEIFDMTATATDCNPNGQFFVVIDFQFQDPASDAFSVMGNGTDYGDFLYTDLPIELGPFPGDDGTLWEFVVSDNDSPNCTDFVEVGAVSCATACDVDNVIVEVVTESADGTTFEVSYDSNAAPPNTLGFDVEYNGIFIGFYPYSQLPAEIFVPCNLGAAGVITLCDNDTECCRDIEIELAACEAECALFDLVIEPLPCTPNGVFFVELDFQFENTGANGFTVLGNGNTYGSFAYANLPITIGPLDGDGTTVYEFIAVDNDLTGCAVDGAIDPVECATGDCNLSDLVADPLSSNDDGTLFFVNFNSSGTSNLGFDVFYNGESLGFFSYDDLPLELFVPCNLGASGELKVCDNDNPDCCTTTIIELPECAGNPSDLKFILPGESGETGTTICLPVTVLGFTNIVSAQYSINYDPDVLTFTGAQNFNLSGLGASNIGNPAPGDITFSWLADDPLSGETVPDGTAIFELCFELTCGGNNESGLIFSGEPSSVEVTTPDGPIDPLFDNGFINVTGCSGDCQITDLIVEAYECDSDGNFLVDIDFNFTGTSNVFKLYVNGELYESYSYADLFITAGPFPGDGSVYLFEVFDAEFPNCGAEVEIEAPDCSNGGACSITDLVAEPTVCEIDGTYSYVIDFNHSNGSAGGFRVKIGPDIFGPFDYADLPVSVGPFPGDGTAYSILVRDVDDASCQATTTGEPVECVIECVIYDVVTTVDCTGNGEYVLAVDFSFANTGNSGFSVAYNGVVQGSFAYGNLPLVLGPFPADGLPNFLQIRDNEIGGCKAEVPVEPVVCTDECTIFNLIGEAECTADGLYNVFIDFDYVNVTGDSFELTINNVVTWELALADLPIVLGPLPGPINGFTTFDTEICILDNSDCCAETVIELPDCDAPPCELTNLEVLNIECDDTGNFFATLDFDFVSTGNAGFEVGVNNQSYGNFNYGDLPITIGPIPVDGEPVTYVVRDNEVGGCKATLTTDPVDCNSDPCEVFDLVLDPGACEPGGGTYELFLDFGYSGAPGMTFDVIVAGQVIGTFNLNDLPIIVPGVPVLDEPVTIVTVCLTGAPNCCVSAEYPTPDCPTLSPVWPGDANSSNKANNYDVLNLGLAFGAAGPERNSVSTNWEGFPATDWTDFFPVSNANYKHADTNGDGVVDFADLNAIEENYNLTHGLPMPDPNDIGNQNDPPLFFDLPDPGDIELGDPFTAPVTLGSTDLPVEDFYGLAFTLSFDPVLIDPTSVSIQFLPSFLGVPGQDLMVFHTVFPAEGLIDVAAVRIDQSTVSGSGDIANFIGIIDDVLGRKELELEIQEVRGIRGDETPVPLQLPLERIFLDDLGEALEHRSPSATWRVFPNPATEWVMITSETAQAVNTWELVDARGRTVRAGTSLPDNRIDLSGLPAGMYIIRMHSTQDLFTERIMKQ